MKNRTVLLSLLLLVLLGASSAAQAGPITYQYNGGSFYSPFMSGIPAGVTGITATFTVDLAANLNFATVPVSSWRISDGLTVIDNTSADYGVFVARASTHSDGSLYGFSMYIRWNPYNTVEHPIPLGGNYIQYLAWGVFPNSQMTFYCTASNSDGTCSEGSWAASSNGGTLALVTAQPVPESGSTLLFLSIAFVPIALSSQWWRR